MTCCSGGPNQASSVEELVYIKIPIRGRSTLSAVVKDPRIIPFMFAGFGGAASREKLFTHGRVGAPKNTPYSVNSILREYINFLML